MVKFINRFGELCLGCFCPGKPNFQLLHICHDKGLGTSQLKHNGPAIKGGCVTRRKHRLGPDTLARKLSRCKEGMARFLPVMVQIFWLIRVSRYKVSRSRNLSPY